MPYFSDDKAAAQPLLRLTSLMTESEHTTQKSILIVGGGAFGLSSALQLIRNGYDDITVVDPYPIPSPASAANDVNKIVEGPDDDDMSVAENLSQKLAMDSWLTDPVYKPFYHATGTIFAASSDDAFAAYGDPEVLANKPGYKKLESPEDFRRTMPAGVLTGDFPGWKGWYIDGNGGWGHARKTLESVHRECERLGVKFITNHNGDIGNLIVVNGEVKGAKAKNGAEHYADVVILCAGAYSNELYDFKDQLRPTAWTLGHIKMEEDERKLFKNLPVLYNNELGFFMEPDEDRGELKVCDEHPGYMNWAPDGERPTVPGGPSKDVKRSIPYSRHSLPDASVSRIREFLSAAMPQLADRPLCFGRICWDSDTPDRRFLIDKAPGESSLIVAVGASGHGFMNMPAVGKIVHSLLENRMDPVFQKAFGWRPESAKDRDFWDRQNRFGAGRRIMDLQKVDHWIDLPYTEHVNHIS